MNNKSKRFQQIILKLNSTLNKLISEINNNMKSQILFTHTISINLNQEEQIMNFFLNEKHLPSEEIKLGQTNYFKDVLKQLNEILNKMHFLNCHIRMIILDEKKNEIIFELPSENLKIPKFSDIPRNFGAYFGEKKLDKENILIKSFSDENDNFKIIFDLCYIFHNFAKYGTFDLLLFNNRLYDINLSKDQNIINELKNRMFFDLNEDNILINFTKLKNNCISLFIFGNFIYTKKDSQDNGNEDYYQNNKEIIEFIINCMNSVSDEFYEKIKIFSENKQMNYYFDTITNCLKDIYTTTNDQELFEVFSKLFEPAKEDPHYIQNKLAKNFLLSSSKK